MKFPTWFPFPSSWLNAVLLLFLTVATSYISDKLFDVGFNFSEFADSPEPFILFGVVALLSPIPVIALFHHFIHLGIGKMAPKLQSPEIGKVKGFLPGLISWWEGLQSWLVMSVSTLSMIGIATVTYRFFNIDFSPTASIIHGNEDGFMGLLGISWLVCAAYLYQVAHLVERRLMAIASKTRNVRYNGLNE
ncbi:hypothetical protein IQ268_11145 [Oculatella sp. LEGE 06141]|nr:hypothetical protein [Oculatella sp. LEGE 06141]